MHDVLLAADFMWLVLSEFEVCLLASNDLFKQPKTILCHSESSQLWRARCGVSGQEYEAGLRVVGWGQKIYIL
jgi:hypothetical protein